jgi:hypothetical protein
MSEEDNIEKKENNIEEQENEVQGKNIDDENLDGKYETDEENPEVEELDLEKRLMAIDDEVLTVKGVATLTLNPNG